MSGAIDSLSGKVEWACGHTAVAACGECFDARVTELAELNALSDLQYRRSMAATKRWQAAHPDQKDVFPDLGKLLEWMMGEMDRLRRELDEALRGWAKE